MSQQLWSLTPPTGPPPQTFVPAAGGASAAVSAAKVASARGPDPGPRCSLEDFEPLEDREGRCLGKGSWGVVRRVRRRGTGDVYALKTIWKSEVLDAELASHVEREIQVQQSLRHENILRLYGYFEDAEAVYLLLELCSRGELYGVLRTQRGRRFPEPVARHYFCQVVHGLRYLHSQGIVHRDLKPENLLVNHDGVLKIADFGWCAMTGAPRTTFCGTLDYLAPEMIQGRGHNQMLDVWSLGVLLFEMCVGKPPFQSTDHGLLVANILAAAFCIPSFVPTMAADLIVRLLRKEPQDRLSLDDVLRHPWVTGQGDASTPVSSSSSRPHRPSVMARVREIEGRLLAASRPSPPTPFLGMLRPGNAGALRQEQVHGAVHHLQPGAAVKYQGYQASPQMVPWATMPSSVMPGSGASRRIVNGVEVASSTRSAAASPGASVTLSIVSSSAAPQQRLVSSAAPAASRPQSRSASPVPVRSARSERRAAASGAGDDRLLMSATHVEVGLRRDTKPPVVAGFFADPAVGATQKVTEASAEQHGVSANTVAPGRASEATTPPRPHEAMRASPSLSTQYKLAGSALLGPSASGAGSSVAPTTASSFATPLTAGMPPGVVTPFSGASTPMRGAGPPGLRIAGVLPYAPLAKRAQRDSTPSRGRGSWSASSASSPGLASPEPACCKCIDGG